MRIPRYIRIHRWLSNDNTMAIFVKDKAGRWWSGIMMIYTTQDEVMFRSWDHLIYPVAVGDIPGHRMKEIVDWVRSIRWVFTSPIGLKIDHTGKNRRIPCTIKGGRR